MLRSKFIKLLLTASVVVSPLSGVLVATPTAFAADPAPAAETGVQLPYRDIMNYAANQNTRLWDRVFRSGPIESISSGAAYSHYPVASMDGSQIYVSGGSLRTKLGAGGTYEEIKSEPGVTETEYKSVSYYYLPSPDGKYVAYGHSLAPADPYTVEINVKDAVTGVVVKTFTASAVSSPLQWSPDGRYLVFNHVSYQENRFQLYDLQEDKKVDYLFPGNEYELTDQLVWSPDGSTVYAAGYDSASNTTGLYQNKASVVTKLDDFPGHVRLASTADNQSVYLYSPTGFETGKHVASFNRTNGTLTPLATGVLDTLGAVTRFNVITEHKIVFNDAYVMDVRDMSKAYRTSGRTVKGAPYGMHYRYEGEMPTYIQPFVVKYNDALLPDITGYDSEGRVNLEGSDLDKLTVSWKDDPQVFGYEVLEGSTVVASKTGSLTTDNGDFYQRAMGTMSSSIYNQDKYMSIVVPTDALQDHTFTLRLKDAQGATLSEKVLTYTSKAAVLGGKRVARDAVVELGGLKFSVLSDNVILSRGNFFSQVSSGPTHPATKYSDSWEQDTMNSFINGQAGRQLNADEKAAFDPTYTFHSSEMYKLMTGVEDTGALVSNPYSYTSAISMPSWELLLNSNGYIGPSRDFIGVSNHDRGGTSDTKSQSIYSGATNGGGGVYKPAAIAIKPGTVFTGSGTESDPYKVQSLQALDRPDLTVTKVDSKTLRLDWPAISDAEGYIIYDDNTSTPTEITRVTSNSYTASDLDPGTYRYRVQAYNTLGDRKSAMSDRQMEFIDPAANYQTPVLRIERQKPGNSRVNWDQVTDASTGTRATGYRVYRDGVFVSTEPYPGYTDSDTVLGQTYKYTVQAYWTVGASEGLSAMSNEVSVVVSDMVDPNLYASQLRGELKVRVSVWEEDESYNQYNPPTSDYYVITRTDKDTNEEETFRLENTKDSDTLHYMDQQVELNHTYVYTTTGYKAGVASMPSSSYEVTIQMPLPVTVTQTTYNSVTLNWSEKGRAYTEYAIYPYVEEYFDAAQGDYVLNPEASRTAAPYVVGVQVEDSEDLTYTITGLDPDKEYRFMVAEGDAQYTPWIFGFATGRTKVQDAPVDPTPTPVDPAPVDPSPVPVDPTPTPVDPAPVPVDPTPAPVDPKPAPVDPLPVPVDPSPAPAPAPAPIPVPVPVPAPVPVKPTPEPETPPVVPVVPPAPEPAPVSYPDVRPESFYARAVSALSSAGVIKGTPSGNFLPDREVTRVEFALMLKRAMGYTSDKGYQGGFDDLVQSAWYMPELTVALNTGVTKGFTDRSYRPNTLIPREQSAIMLANIMRKYGIEVPRVTLSFADDASIIAWAQNDVYIAASWGILTGYPDETVRPKGHLTRGEAAVLIWRLMNWMDEQEMQ